MHRRRILDVKTFINDIRSILQAHANPALVQKYARYFVEGYDAYGVDLKDIKTEMYGWIRDYREPFGLEGFLQLGDELVSTGKYEEGMIAISLIKHFRHEFTPRTLDRLGIWLEIGLCNWAHVDVFSGDVLSVFVVEKIVALGAFSTWRNATSKWKRRSVPVTLLSAIKDDYPIKTLLEFIEPMIMDEEKVVHQGLGWFLREAWKKEPAIVEAFLLKWKDRCARLIIQYATEKMDKQKKSVFKKNK